jgi:two-component system cell cycle sensor histidine kinase/response regulator CckA
MDKMTKAQLIEEIKSLKKQISHLESISDNGLIQDVTERKRAEEKLKKSEEQFRTLAEQMPLGLSFISSDGNYEYVNPGFAKLMGYGLEDFSTGHEWFVKVFPDADYRRHVIDSWKNDLKNTRQGEARPREYSVTCKDGSKKIILFRPVTMNDGRQFVLYEDITERKKAEKTIISAERKFRDLLETISLVAVMLDTEGKIIFCNEFFLNLTGWSRDEVIDKSWFDLFLAESEKSPVYAMFKSNILTGSIPPHYENPIITRSGEKRLLVWDNTLLLNAEGTIIGVASIGTDVTEHRKVEEQLRHAQKMEAIGTLAGGVAHDFNNILSAIVGYASLLQMKMPPDSPLLSSVEHILNASEKAAGLTQSLLAFSRKHFVDLRPLDLNETIKRFHGILSRLISEEIIIVLNLSMERLVINADKGQIEQVLMNLVTNARDAMPDGGKLVIETSSVGISEDDKIIKGVKISGNYAVLSVSDTGTGIDDKTLEHIFDPFFTTKEVGKGTGLGLSIIYGIVEKHSGYIKVSSRPEHGTEIKIYIPLTSAEIKHAERSILRIKPAVQATILIVEDDDFVREILQMLLQEFGYKLLTANSGEQGLKIFCENKNFIDLVISDVVMPHGTGGEIHKEIIKLKPNMKFLFMSGYTNDVISKKGVVEGDFEFITKPVIPHEFLNKVADILKK